VYYAETADVEELGWDRFVAGAFEAIFVGYRSTAGIRTICRRWSDLLQAGLGCSEELADELVRSQVMVRQDRDLMAIRDAEQLLTAMDEVLADVGGELAETDEVSGPARVDLLAAHRELRGFLRDRFLTADEAAESGGQNE
jgi:hypothetical protein